MMNSDRRLTTGDIMKYCHVGRSTVLKWAKSGKLSAYIHPEGQYRTTRVALIDFLKAYNMPIDDELLREAREVNEDIVGFGLKKEAWSSN